MKFLSLTVVEISLTKNLERKKKGQTQGRTNRRMPICNPTIQLVLVDLYTKYEVSILNGCGDIFDEKVLRNYGRTDGRTDGTTDRCKPVYPPLFQSGGINTVIFIHKESLVAQWLSIGLLIYWSRIQFTMEAKIFSILNGVLLHAACTETQNSQ